MFGNNAFELVSERGWRRGLSNLLDNELARWWKTRMWWIQCLICVSLTGFFLGPKLFSNTGFRIEEAAGTYAVFAGFFTVVAAIIIMQGVLVGEKKDGMATWVLSKTLGCHLREASGWRHAHSTEFAHPGPTTEWKQAYSVDRLFRVDWKAI